MGKNEDRGVRDTEVVEDREVEEVGVEIMEKISVETGDSDTPPD